MPVRLVSSKKGQVPHTSTASYVSGAKDGPRYLVTAYHNLYECDIDSVKVGVNDAGGKESLKDLVEGSFLCSPQADICVFKLTNGGNDKLVKGGRRPAKVATSSLKANPGGYAVGHPSVEVLGARKYPFAWVSPVTVSQTGSFEQCVGDKYAKGDAKLTRVIMLTSPLTYGFSGGPVLCQTATGLKGEWEVVGIVQGGDPKSGKLSWCIAAEELLKLLDSGENRWEVYPPQGGKWKAPLFNSEAYQRTSDSVVVAPQQEVVALNAQLTEGERLEVKSPIAATFLYESATGAFTVSAGIEQDSTVYVGRIGSQRFEIRNGSQSLGWLPISRFDRYFNQK